MHPYMTAELVRQLRAGLEAEPRNQRLIRQLPPRARTDPERRGLARRYLALPDGSGRHGQKLIRSQHADASIPGRTGGRYGHAQ
jgi:hypothetical protein